MRVFKEHFLVFIVMLLPLTVLSAKNDIFYLIQQGDTAQIATMLKNDKRALFLQDNDKRTPLHHAAITGNVDIIELLIDNKAPLNSQDYQGFTPLHWAASKGHLDAVEALIKHGADIHIKTNRGRTPLFLVAMNNGNTRIAKLLIDAGADVNTTENSGVTPLPYATFRGFNEIIDLLLDNGADVRTDSDLWFEVFHRACSIGHRKLAKLMINQGMDVSRKNEDGRLPLHSAAEGGAVDLIDFLVKEGNPVDSRDYCGNTPLHLAAQSGHRDAVYKLIDLGSDVNIRNTMGETPYNLVSDQDNHEIGKYLLESGADPHPPEFPMLTGKFLGQSVPDLEPIVFAPGLVSTYATIHGCPAFSPDGKEIYWSVVDSKKRGSTIYCMQERNNKWTKPAPAIFSSEYSYDVPYFSPDGKHLFFLSNRPVVSGTEPSKENIWVINKLDDSWSDPKLIGPAINEMDLHWQFSVAENGTIYFGSSSGNGLGLNDIYRSRLVNGVYQPPQNLGNAINSEYPDFAPCIAPDESFHIFTSTGRSTGSGLYISFREESGEWSDPKYMPDPFGNEALLTTMSPDGKYLFFAGRREGKKGVFWVDTQILELFKPVN